MERFIYLLLIFFSLSTPAFSFTLSNFESPESVCVDPDDGSYYVSNINGELTAKDSNGYISKIDASGNTVIQKFIGSAKSGLVLHGPKGLSIVGKNLFVTDIDTVKGFDRVSGKPTVLVDLSRSGAKFLNDITADAQGNLYVSDLLANRIYKINPDANYEASVYLEGRELGLVNGLLVNPKNQNLMAVTFGSGQLMEIDRGGNLHTLKRGLAALDGVDYDSSGNLYVSSFEKGEIYKISNLGRGTLSVHASGLTTPADLFFDRKKDELIVPSLKGNSVTTTAIPRAFRRDYFKKK